MMADVFISLTILFILAFLIDISVNLRRMVGSLDRLWRKLSEINDLMLRK